MTHKEIINKAGEFCTDFRELADELKMFSDSVGGQRFAIILAGKYKIH